MLRRRPNPRAAGTGSLSNRSREDSLHARERSIGDRDECCAFLLGTGCVPLLFQALGGDYNNLSFMVAGQ